MTTQDKLKELESWAEDLRNGNTAAAAVFKNPDLVADRARLVVSALFHVSIEEITSKKRTDRIAWARQVAMVMTHRISDCTLEEVGRIFGKDHGTVIHAERVVQQRTSMGHRFSQQVELVEQKLREVFETPKQ